MTLETRWFSLGGSQCAGPHNPTVASREQRRAFGDFGDGLRSLRTSEQMLGRRCSTTCLVVQIGVRLAVLDGPMNPRRGTHAAPQGMAQIVTFRGPYLYFVGSVFFVRRTKNVPGLDFFDFKIEPKEEKSLNSKTVQAEI